MSRPDHMKLGYDHMVEMHGIEDALRADGVTGVQLHFAAIRTYEALHKNDPSYRERQDAARGERWVGSASILSPADLMWKALEEIRDGHNDPRALARAVLEKCK